MNIDEGVDNQLIWIFNGYDPYGRPFNYTIEGTTPAAAPFTIDIGKAMITIINNWEIGPTHSKVGPSCATTFVILQQ